MSERFELAKIALLALSDEELARIEHGIPLMRRVVRMYDDRLTAVGLTDLDCEAMVQATLAEMDSDLDELVAGHGQTDPVDA